MGSIYLTDRVRVKREDKEDDVQGGFKGAIALKSETAERGCGPSLKSYCHNIIIVFQSFAVRYCSLEQGHTQVTALSDQ